MLLSNAQWVQNGIKRLASHGAWITYVAAQLVPSKCDRFQISFTLLSSNPDITSAWSYTGYPSSLVLSLEAVVKAGDCLLMSDSAMKQLMSVDMERQESVFCVKVEISSS